MGSGKTLVGKSLAETINQPFIDLDTQIEISEQKTVSEIFDAKGEIYFRKKEREVLEVILSDKNNSVLSLGGGTPCLGDTMELLNAQKDVQTFYLKASNETLTQRLYKEKSKRPLISHISSREALNDFIRKHLFERNYYYNKATHKISVDDKDVNSVVAEIVVTLFNLKQHDLSRFQK